MPTNASADQLRDEFARIASLTPPLHIADPLESWLLQQIPLSARGVLDVGCGVGDVARSIASTGRRVTALDFASGMIDEAKRRTPRELTIDYVCADMFEWLASSDSQFDCIVSIATLHHVDFAQALRAMARALRPGGRLLIVDLVDRGGPRNVPINTVAYAVLIAREILKPAAARSLKFRLAYRHHGRNETYLSLNDARRIAQGELPGAEVRGHLLWRYTLSWDKPFTDT